MEQADEEIMKHFEKQNVEELQHLLTKSLSLDDLKFLLKKRVVEHKGDPVPFLRALFYGLPHSSKDADERKIFLYKCMIAFLQKDHMSVSVKSEVVGVLLSEMDALKSSELIQLSDLYINTVKSQSVVHAGGRAHWLDLFPKLLSNVALQDRISYDGGTVTGESCKRQILESFCAIEWNPEIVLPLATMFKDISLGNDELKLLIDRLLAVLSHLELQKIPALVNRLLLLSTKGHRILILQGIIDFFVKEDKKFERESSRNRDFEEDGYSVENLRQVEGTATLYVVFSVRQDQELGKEYIRHLKTHQHTPAVIFTNFNVALMLAVSQINQFEEQMQDLLKNCIIKCYRDNMNAQTEWTGRIIKEDFDVEACLSNVVWNSSYGWDHVTYGLMHLGFVLMDSYGPKGAFGKVDLSAVFHRTPANKSCELGSNILFETFKLHKISRAKIVDQILSRLVSKATSPVNHYLHLLASIINYSPQIMLEWTHKIREVFDYLCFLPEASGRAFLVAIQPLMKVSLPLKDAVMLVLRKSIFSNQPEARKIAVVGYLLILKNFKVLGEIRSSQSSQSSQSSTHWISQVQVEADVHHRSARANVNETLCLEILASLRRCLKQQLDIRLMLYAGLADVVHVNKQLRGPVKQLLLTHLKTYYERDKMPPVFLDKCVSENAETVFLTEPLSHLLSSIVHCFVGVDAGNDDDDDDTSRAECEQLLRSITHSVLNCETEDFGLDKTSDFTSDTSTGMKNKISATLLMGIYEVLLEANFLQNESLKKEDCEKVVQLFDRFSEVSELLRNAAAVGKKGKQHVSLKQPKSMFSLRFVGKFLESLYDNKSRADEVSNFAELRQRLDITGHVVVVAVQKLKELCTSTADVDRYFDCCCQIARSLLVCYRKGDREASANREQKEVMQHCSEALASVVHVCCLRYRNQLGDFIARVLATEADERAAEEDLLHGLIKRMQDVVLPLLNDERQQNGQHAKELVHLLSIISELADEYPHSSAHLHELQKWLQHLCCEQKVDELPVLRSLLTLLLSTTYKISGCAKILFGLSQDIHVQLKDIDEDIDLSAEDQNFAVVSSRNAVHCATILIQQIEQILGDVEWIISMLKSRLGKGNDAYQHEKQVIQQLGMTIQCVCELAQSAVPVGNCQDLLLRSSAKLYNVLASLAKYYVAVCAGDARSICCRYEKLVKLSGANLTNLVYPMITYIQTTQSERIQQAADKARKKKTGENAAGGKAVAVKTSKSIPNLVFAVEQYERFLIQLGKKCKVDLMAHFKMSTARDFRIDTSALNAALGEQSDDDHDDDDNDTSISDENRPTAEVTATNLQDARVTQTIGEPPAKKLRAGLASKRSKLRRE